MFTALLTTPVTAVSSASLVIGVDLGTESVRVGVFSPNGTVVSTASVAYTTYFPRPGWAEQDPLECQ